MIGLPDVTIGTDTISVTFTGIAPTRAVSGEESLAGIVALDPPTIRTQATRGESVQLLIRATLSAIEATDGATIDPATISRVAYSVSYAVTEALENG